MYPDRTDVQSNYGVNALVLARLGKGGAMNKSIGRVPAAIAIVVAFLLGGGISLAVAYRVGTHGMVGLALAHELETTGLCANSLKLNAANDRERLARLLEQRLDSAVGQAASLTDQGAQLLGPSPNLRDSVRRAANYYAAVGDLARQRRTETLLATLEREQ